MTPYFDHEKLDVYRESIAFCAWVARKLANPDQAGEAKRTLAGIVRMLMGLLKRFSERADVLKEEEADYGSREDQEQDQDQEQEGKK